MKTVFVLLLCATQDPSVEGIWSGTLEVQNFKLRVAFHIVSKDGRLTATLDSIDQGANGIVVDSVKVNDKAVTMTIKSIDGVYSGEIEGDSIKGTWTQRGTSLPLDLSRVEKAPELSRPQTPKPPFPYKEEEIAYENKDGGVKLAGTLTLPEGDGPFPAVLLITGSGAQDRDETLFGHKPFAILADALTRKGFAVLRLDDRGIGGSTGNVLEATLDDSVGDALAGIEFLKGRKEVDAKRIGLLGHSEGGWVAPIVATRSKDVAFVVMIAGPGLGGEAILHLQTSGILRANGATDEAIETEVEYAKRIYAVLKEESDNDKARGRILPIIGERLKDLSEEQAKASAPQIEQQVKTLTSRWFRSILTYDPRPILEKVECPVLAVIGEKDLQVPAKDNKEALEAGFKSNGAAKVVILEGLNHLLQRSQTGLPAEYSTLEETLAPEALEIIVDWVVAQKR